MKNNNALWNVDFSSRANKQMKKLPEKVRLQINLLAREIEHAGPIRKNWAHFSPLTKGKGIPANSYHCHLKSGKPTYVACWHVENKKINIVEIYYVGTHENAPY